MDDTISRQQAIATAVSAAIDWHRLANPQYSIAYSIGEAMRALPPAQPGWIPCGSGKLPKESGYYTVTAYDGTTKRVTHAKYQKRLKRWELTGARAYWRVLAWLPPIEPWKGGQDDNR